MKHFHIVSPLCWQLWWERREHLSRHSEPPECTGQKGNNSRRKSNSRDHQQSILLVFFGCSWALQQVTSPLACGDFSFLYINSHGKYTFFWRLHSHCVKPFLVSASCPTSLTSKEVLTRLVRYCWLQSQSLLTENSDGIIRTYGHSCLEDFGQLLGPLLSSCNTSTAFIPYTSGLPWSFSHLAQFSSLLFMC